MGFLSTFAWLFLFLVSDFYPCYYSLKGFRSPNNISDVEYWHKYWIIRSFLLMIDFLFYDLIQKIPLILVIKISLYMFLAVFGGAGLIYDKLLYPFLTKNEHKIDEGLEMISDKAKGLFSQAFSYVKSYAIAQFWNLIIYKNQQKTEQKEPKVELKPEQKEPKPAEQDT